MTWYYADNGRQVGPVEESALDDLVKSGVVRDDTLVWREGLPNWQPHAAVRGVRVEPQPIPAVIPVAAGTGFCSECGRPFPTDQLLNLGTASVCAQCKPIYLQRVREGGQGVGARHYGGFWIRFVARIIDGVILAVVGFILRTPLVLMLGAGAVRPDVSAIPILLGFTGIVLLLEVALSVAYEAFFLTTRGATPGKMVVGLKVIRSDGGPISAGVAVGRYFAQWISALILWIGYIMAGIDTEKRALHDRICDTRVIYVR